MRRTFSGESRVLLMSDVRGSNVVQVPDELRYDQMRAASVSQAKYRKLTNPELAPMADVRRVAWWRVRGLWRIAYLPQLLGVLLIGAATLYGMAISDPQDVPFWILIVPLVSIAWFVISGAGVLRALRLSRAAKAATVGNFRYVLLHSYTWDSPWLVFFPAQGDISDRPVAALRLSYGPDRDLFRDLPGPLGNVRLTGCTGASQDALVIPWIEEQPYWPQGVLWVLNLEESIDVRTMTELVHPE
jgi:hypothetical protein